MAWREMHRRAKALGIKTRHQSKSLKVLDAVKENGPVTVREVSSLTAK